MRGLMGISHRYPLDNRAQMGCQLTTSRNPTAFSVLAERTVWQGSRSPLTVQQRIELEE